MSRDKHNIQRIRVNRDGYDASGAYWGAGPDIFIVTSTDGSDEITVRARNVTEARRRIAAELARKPGEQRPADSEPIGGHAPRKTRYEFEWLNPVTIETVRVRITHARDYLSTGSDHIEVESIKPMKAPLPITETGYRSHFLSALELVNAGGPVTFVTAWIEQEAKGKAWRAQAQARDQGDLFQWAEAKAEVGKRRKPRPSRPAARTRTRAGKDRTPE